MLAACVQIKCSPARDPDCANWACMTCTHRPSRPCPIGPSYTTDRPNRHQYHCCQVSSRMQGLSLPCQQQGLQMTAVAAAPGTSCHTVWEASTGAITRTWAWSTSQSPRAGAAAPSVPLPGQRGGRPHPAAGQERCGGTFHRGCLTSGPSPGWNNRPGTSVQCVSFGQRLAPSPPPASQRQQGGHTAVNSSPSTADLCPRNADRSAQFLPWRDATRNLHLQGL